MTVVDALRMQSEFGCGDDLMKKNLAEDDLESLVIQQIEFCNIILLNKASEVTPEELGRVKSIIRALQPTAEIITCDYGDVDFDKILNTKMFDFDKVATSATWIKEVEGAVVDDDDEDEHEHHHHDDHDEDEHEHHHHHHDDEDEDEHEHEHEHHHHEHGEDFTCGCHDHEHHHHHHDHDDDDEEEEHGHHHHHHHDHEGGEVEEYGIGTFVYYRREPFNMARFDEFVARKMPKNVIRVKGICYFKNEYDNCYIFEQAGKQVQLRDAGLWFATMPANELAMMMDREPTLRRDWDDTYGDRMQKLVFIGQHLDKEALVKDLDACLTR